MRRKKQRLSLMDVARLPLSPARVTPGYETTAEANARVEAEIKMAEFDASPEGQIQALTQQSNRFMQQEIAEAEEATSASNRQPTDVMRAAPDAAGIVLGLYELTSQGAGEWDRNEAYETWCGDMHERGIRITSTEGILKFVRFAQVNFQSDVAIRPSNFMTLFERAVKLGILDSSMVEGYSPEPVEQPAVVAPVEKEVTRQDLEDKLAKMPADSREGHAECLKLIGHLFSYDVQKMYHAWAEQMERDYGVDVLTPKITHFAGRWFDETNSNPLTPKNYDRLRIVLSVRGYLGGAWGSHMTPQEKLERAVSTGEFDTSTFQGRQAYANKLQAIQDAEYAKRHQS